MDGLLLKQLWFFCKHANQRPSPMALKCKEESLLCIHCLFVHLKQKWGKNNSATFLLWRGYTQVPIIYAYLLRLCHICTVVHWHLLLCFASQGHCRDHTNQLGQAKQVMIQQPSTTCKSHLPFCTFFPLTSIKELIICSVKHAAPHFPDEIHN